MTLWTNQYELIVNKNLNTPACFLSDFTVMYKNNANTIFWFL